MFTPKIGVSWSNLTVAYFSKGLVQPPPSYSFWRIIYSTIWNPLSGGVSDDSPIPSEVLTWRALGDCFCGGKGVWTRCFPRIDLSISKVWDVVECIFGELTVLYIGVCTSCWMYRSTMFYDMLLNCILLIRQPQTYDLESWLHYIKNPERSHQTNWDWTRKMH